MHRIGFLQKVAASAEIDAGMQPWIEAILAAEPGTVRAQKRLIEDWLNFSGVPAGVQAGIDAFTAAFHGDAPNRRLRAFVERPCGGNGARLPSAERLPIRSPVMYKAASSFLRRVGG